MEGAEQYNAVTVDCLWSNNTTRSVDLQLDGERSSAELKLESGAVAEPRFSIAGRAPASHRHRRSVPAIGGRIKTNPGHFLFNHQLVCREHRGKAACDTRPTRLSFHRNW